MKKLLVATTVFGLLSANAALAESPKFYVGGNLKYAQQHDADRKVDSETDGTIQYDSGLGFAIQGGIDISGNRIELELGQESYKNKNLSDEKYKASSVHVNYFHDFKFSDKISPYIGGGLGTTKFEIEGDGYNLSDNMLTYQFGVGAGYSINENNTVTAGYRYRGSFSDTEVSSEGSKVEAPYSVSALEIGYRFSF